MQRQSKLLLIGLFAALVIFAAAGYLFNYIFVQVPRNQLLEAVHVGMKREEVVSKLGQPKHIARSFKDMQTECFFPKPAQPVEKEVLEYHKGFSWKIYVYIGRNNRVSHIILAGT